MQTPRTIRRRTSSEDGFTLLAVMILLAIFMIAMSIALPRVTSDIQRDREVETMHRGKQYVRGIQLYFKRFHRYPPNIDALVKTNEIRFVRKKYIDPITGKDDWKPVQFGQNKTPQAMGFFGQPLAGTGGNMMAGTGPDGSSTGLAGSSSLFPSSTPSTGVGAAAGTSPTAGQAAGGFDTTVGNTGVLGGSVNGGLNTGQTIGGMGLIGVSPASEKASILVLKKKKKYNEWEFLYSPLQDMQTMAGGNMNGAGLPTNTGAPGATGLGTGIGITGSTFGSGSGINGSTGASGTTGSGANGNNGGTGPGNNNGSTPILPPTTGDPQNPTSNPQNPQR